MTPTTPSPIADQAAGERATGIVNLTQYAFELVGAIQKISDSPQKLEILKQAKLLRSDLVVATPDSLFGTDEPFGEDGSTADGFHQCTPFNGGHSWTLPYRERMAWVIRCHKCLRVDSAPPADQAAAKAKEFMVAARNAQMFQDIRSVVATCADLKARAPYRHVEAQRLLPLLDAFLGEGYTGRMIEFKRMLDSTAPTTGSTPERSDEWADSLSPQWKAVVAAASHAASVLSEDAILAIAIDHGLGTAVVESIVKALLAASMGGEKS